MNWREISDRTLAIAGVVVAICALAVTFYQVHLMHAQARIAVWPHIQQYASYPPGSPPRFTEFVRNAGLGPAIIRNLDIEINGRSLHSWASVARGLTGIKGPVKAVTTDLPNGYVLLPGQTVAMLEMYGAAATAAVNGNAAYVTTICYCSLYGDCWRSRSSTSVNERVHHCPNARTSGFYARTPTTSPDAATGPG